MAPPEEVVARRSLPTPADHVAQALHEWRRRAARAAAVPESVVCNDRELDALVQAATTRTLTIADIEEVLGPMATRRHGDRILQSLPPSP